MTLTTIKILLQILVIGSFGYLSLAFFQKLFCHDISTLDYAKFMSTRGQIWNDFKRAFKSQKYRSFVLLFILCMFGFYNSLHEMGTDWQLREKLILWQMWAVLFCYAVYLSHNNMKLKLLYDITGKDHKQAKIVPLMETPNTLKLKEQITSVINYKKSCRYLGFMLVVAILCCGYAFYSMKKAEKAVARSNSIVLSRDSVINSLNLFKDSINVQLTALKRERDSLQIRRTSEITHREAILKRPIDYSNDAERKAILNEMLKEAKK